MSEEMKVCPQCESLYGYYLNDELYACPECDFQWNPAKTAENESIVVKDVNGNQLHDGDSVVVIKTLKVKGAAQPIKAGTKVKRIRIKDGDHNIDCKIDGYGAMSLKSEFVKKA